MSDPSLLSIPGLADRAYLFINHQLTGLLARGEQGGTSLPLQLSPGDTLSVLVENQGTGCSENIARSFYQHNFLVLSVASNSD